MKWNADSNPEFSGKSSGCLATILRLFKGQGAKQPIFCGWDYQDPYYCTLVEGSCWAENPSSQQPPPGQFRR
ncbi:MAG TPA: hypothetical protein VK168_08995 [Saprospiraceae bacterium]|nr:hypothetical protein [Saprospiraceae bacterium]